MKRALETTEAGKEKEKQSVCKQLQAAAVQVQEYRTFRIQKDILTQPPPRTRGLRGNPMSRMKRVDIHTTSRGLDPSRKTADPSALSLRQGERGRVLAPSGGNFARGDLAK